MNSRQRKLLQFGLIAVLAIAAAAALFESARWILRVVDIPPQLEIGFGLLLSGFVLVMVSLIVERIKDSRLESDLRE